MHWMVPVEQYLNFNTPELWHANDIKDAITNGPEVFRAVISVHVQGGRMTDLAELDRKSVV